MELSFVDVHAHLCDEKFEDVLGVIESAKKVGVKKIITASYNLFSCEKNLGIAKDTEGVFATVGVHPENVDEATVSVDNIAGEDVGVRLETVDEEILGVGSKTIATHIESEASDYLSKLEHLARNKKVVAIGEIGLDYHWRTDNKELQKKFFTLQIQLANKLNLPIVVHSRDAMGDTIEILKSCPPKRESLMHCYGGSIESARELMKLNFSFSFGGVCTFKNAKNVCETIKALPIEKIMTETDCPYMTPEPYRGKVNEPKYIPLIAKRIAEIKNLPLEEVARQVSLNAEKMFKI